MSDCRTCPHGWLKCDVLDDLNAAKGFILTEIDRAARHEYSTPAVKDEYGRSIPKCRKCHDTGFTDAKDGHCFIKEPCDCPRGQQEVGA